ncbi:MAG TPA: phosphatase PAP2 family protein [Kofleriaceae bacterium]|nr:phosphatase PAP2 family protein [Kofleriaceae bacterium]
MTRARLVILGLVAGARVAAADPVAEPEAAPDPHRVARLVALGVGIGLYATSETVAKDALAPDQCRWCNPPGFDATVHDHLRWANPGRAATISNVTGYLLSPLGAAGLTLAAAWAHPAPWVTFGDDALAIGEAAIYTQLVVQAVKFSVGRQRPDAHDHATASPSNDDNLSFLSGHSALTFSIATAAGTIAQRRHDRLAPVIWATGLTLATATAYLRIAADKHYLSDVVAGAALGTAGGLGLPRLLHALPDDVAVVPAPDGLAVVGAF